MKEKMHIKAAADVLRGGVRVLEVVLSGCANDLPGGRASMSGEEKMTC